MMFERAGRNIHMIICSAFTMAVILIPQVLFAASITSWNDLALADVVYLTEPLIISNEIKFEIDAKFKITEVSGGGGYVPATFYDLQAMHCDHPEGVSEMLMIRPSATPDGSNGLVGVTLKPNCQIEVIVENREIDLPSFFTDSTN